MVIFLIIFLIIILIIFNYYFFYIILLFTAPIVIGASNRAIDLDPALISRFDTIVNFPLPNESERSSILSLYAKHLGSEELKSLAKESNGLSGRDIKGFYLFYLFFLFFILFLFFIFLFLDICANAERNWIGRLLKEYQHQSELSPEQIKMIYNNLDIPLQIYLESLKIRKENTPKNNYDK